MLVQTCIVLIMWDLSCEPYECCWEGAVIVRRQAPLKSNLLLLDFCVTTMGLGKRVNSTDFHLLPLVRTIRMRLMDEIIVCMMFRG